MSAAAGILVHYSAVPYALFLAAHYALVVLPRRGPLWRDLVSIGLPAGVLLGTWFGWAFWAFGLKPTLGSITTAAAIVERANSAVDLCDLLHQLVPCGTCYLDGWKKLLKSGFSCVLSVEHAPRRLRLQLLDAIATLDASRHHRPRLTCTRISLRRQALIHKEDLGYALVASRFARELILPGAPLALSLFFCFPPFAHEMLTNRS
jgi:hypothetical protein